jgi:hypothetical protein
VLVTLIGYKHAPKIVIHHLIYIKTPYLDPYPDGYALQSQPDFYYWNDGLQYYWDMRNIRTDGRGCYDVNCTLKNNLTDTSLLFQDEPNVGGSPRSSEAPFVSDINIKKDSQETRTCIDFLLYTGYLFGYYRWIIFSKAFNSLSVKIIRTVMVWPFMLNAS